MSNTENKDKNDYTVVLFGGVKLSKLEANKVGLTAFFVLFGVAFSYFALGIENKIAAFIIAFTLSVVGYFGIANKVFKPKQNE